MLGPYLKLYDLPGYNHRMVNEQMQYIGKAILGKQSFLILGKVMYFPGRTHGIIKHLKQER
jgi:hypothetical protein